jgi:hypothetical protein
MQLKLAGVAGKYPIIVLHDVRYHELKAVVEFMYTGEVSVAEDDLPRLLSIGDNLRIKGLAEKVGEETSVLPSQSQPQSVLEAQLSSPPSSNRLRARLSSRVGKRSAAEDEEDPGAGVCSGDEDEQLEPESLVKRTKLSSTSSVFENNNVLDVEEDDSTVKDEVRDDHDGREDDNVQDLSSRDQREPLGTFLFS